MRLTVVFQVIQEIFLRVIEFDSNQLKQGEFQKLQRSPDSSWNAAGSQKSLEAVPEAHEGSQFLCCLLHFLCRLTSSTLWKCSHLQSDSFFSLRAKITGGEDFDWFSLGQVDTPRPIYTVATLCSSALLAPVVTIVTWERRGSFQRKGRDTRQIKQFLSTAVFPISHPIVKGNHPDAQGLTVK